MAQTDLGLIKGNTIETGTTLPDSAFNGDLFYNTSTYHIWQWDGTLSTPAWVDKGSIQGPQGEKGDKGDKGDTGAPGPQGDKGDKGDTPTFSLDSNGHLIVTYPY